MNALRLMNGSPAENSLAAILARPARIVFRDMKTLDPGLRAYDALSWISRQGELVIFVNEKHRSAPPAALAAMLAHEALHNDAYNSLQEEIAGWRLEAQVWMALKARDPALSRMPMHEFSLLERENRLEQEWKQGTLDAFVKNNAGYRGLPETSPGFQAPSAMN